MTIASILQDLYDTPLAAFVRQNDYAFPTIESVHVLAISVVVGTIAIVDLRLLGYPSHRKSARQLMLDLLPFTWGAFLIAVIAGSLLFMSNATAYYDNAQFQEKMAAMLLAGVNMAIFHLSAYRKIADWDDASPLPLAARIAGATSLGLWILVVFFGRWVGFTLVTIPF